MTWPAILLITLALGACSPSGTVAYYKAHPHEIDAELTRCLASGDTGQDCLNVRQAWSELHGQKVPNTTNPKDR